MNHGSQNQSTVYHDVCAYHYAGGKVTALEGTQKPTATRSSQRVESLPLIIQKPRWVRFADCCYHVQNEGLYRFWDWGKAKVSGPNTRPVLVQNRQRYSCLIYYQNDILKLLGSLAAIHLHGCRHQQMKHPRRIAQAKKGALSLTCGPSSDFVCTVLKMLGWKARRVSSLRVEGKYNTYDNGHELVEFFWPRHRQWVLADVDMHTMFTRRGRYLNLGQVSALIQSGKDFDLEPLTAPGVGIVDTSDAAFGKFDFSPLIELMAFDPVRKKEWFRRILAVPVLYADGQGWFFCSDKHDLAKVKCYEPYHQFLDKQAWFKRFYPNLTKINIKGA